MNTPHHLEDRHREVVRLIAPMRSILALARQVKCATLLGKALLALVVITGFSGDAFGAATNNILLIIADDYGFDSSSLYNSNPAASQPPTPNIAALAQRGVLFRNAYANPVCSPTRSCIITGQYGFRTGIGTVVGGATGAPPLMAAQFTLPEAFAANPGAGYSLAQFGKWHLGSGGVAGANFPNTRGGWPHYAGGLGGAIENYTNWTKTVNGVTTSNYTVYATTDLVNDAVTWITARGTNKWFAWVAFNAPHTPYHIPPASLAPGYATNTGIGANRRQYEAMVEAMDTEIGRLLAAVDTNKNKTDIIFVGDNGTPGGVIQPPYVNGRGKDTLYEGGTHVPLIVAGPTVVSPGRTNDSLVHVVDFFSTILELAGVNVATTVGTNTIDSRSFLPVLKNTTRDVSYVYTEAFDYAAPSANDGRALRNDRYKLIRFSVSATEALYDLQSDPTELTNLLSSALTATVRSNYNALTWRLGDYQNLITAPTVLNAARTYPQFTLTVALNTNANYALWRAAALNDLAWAPVTNAIIVTNGTTSATLTDPFSLLDTYFYGAMATTP